MQVFKDNIILMSVSVPETPDNEIACYNIDNAINDEKVRGLVPL